MKIQVSFRITELPWSFWVREILWVREIPGRAHRSYPGALPKMPGLVLNLNIPEPGAGPGDLHFQSLSLCSLGPGWVQNCWPTLPGFIHIQGRLRK